MLYTITLSQNHKKFREEKTYQKISQIGQLNEPLTSS